MKKSWHEHRKLAPKEQRTSHDGIVFHSKTELRRWEYLKLLQKAGEISGLERQVKFEFSIQVRENVVINIMAGNKIACYTADFKYRDKSGKEIYEDVKAYRDETSKFRIRVAEGLHRIKITIVMLKSNRWVST